jgi:hypothetical protein
MGKKQRNGRNGETNGKEETVMTSVIEDDQPVQSEDAAVADIVQPDTELEAATKDVVDIPEDNTGKLFLRMFFVNSEKSEKVVTKLKGKVYFPKDPHIQSGWYIASIIEERDTYGVMDTMPIAEVPISLWRQKIIRGVYVTLNHAENQLEIYRSIPADQLNAEESMPILVKPLPEPKYDNGNSIGEILKAKMSQRQ